MHNIYRCVGIPDIPAIIYDISTKLPKPHDRLPHNYAVQAPEAGIKGRDK